MAEAFDWALMRSFLAVMEAGSLLGAARQLSSSQPTLGRHVAQLEAQLGVPLFERTGHGLQPTEAARAIAGHARVMQQGADAVAHALARDQAGIAGTVRISASRAVASYLLPPLLADLRLREPQLAIQRVAAQVLQRQLGQREDAPRMLEQARAGGCRRRALLAAREQRHAGALLQLAQLLADRGLRQEQPRRRGGQAAGVCHGHECA